MRAVILDLVKHTGGTGFIDIVKITGSDTDTKIEAADPNKSVFIKGALKEPLADLKGEVGITNMPLLTGLLNFVSYKTDDASFAVKRREDDAAPEELRFRDALGHGADFRLMRAQLVDDQPEIRTIPWDVEIAPSRSKVQEFTQLAALYADQEKFFTVKTKPSAGDGNDLLFQIGEEGSATHRASMLFHTEVAGTLRGDLNFPTAQVLSILKLAANDTTTLSFSTKGLLKVTVENEIAVYSYFFPAKRR